MYDAIDGADALLVVTEWKIFRSPDFELVKTRMTGKHIFDGRNIYDPDSIKKYDLIYRGIGRPISQKILLDK